MLQSASLAFSLDVMMVLQYWHTEDIRLVQCIGIAAFSTIAVATGSLTWLLWRTNYTKHNLRREDRKNDRTSKQG